MRKPATAAINVRPTKWIWPDRPRYPDIVQVVSAADPDTPMDQDRFARWQLQLGIQEMNVWMVLREIGQRKVNYSGLARLCHLTQRQLKNVLLKLQKENLIGLYNY